MKRADESLEKVQRVTKARWAQAQAWEEAHWVRTQMERAKFGKNIIWACLALLKVKPKFRGDDWNLWWEKAFEDYRFLPSCAENCIELGCGPYTNWRLIAKRCKAQHLFLSDPLIKTYVRFRQTFLAELYRRGFAILDDHPIEECPFADNYFDVTVIINVLDHVRDAGVCLRKAIAITKPGGILVLGQDLTNEDDLQKLRGAPGEIGHPITVDHQWIEEILGKRFDALIQKVISREHGRAPEHHYGTFIFAGRKKV
jgi:SAM-dependent methyltransferase